MAKTTARKPRKRRASAKQAKDGMWQWYLAGVLSVGAVVAYDNRAEIMPMATPFYTASIAKVHPAEKREKAAEHRVERNAEKSVRKVIEADVDHPVPALALPMPDSRPVEQAALDQTPRRSGSFVFCTETFENCVVDGGTFWYGRKKVEIADILAPRIKQAKCDNERKVGSLAKRRLWEILNAGDVHLAGGDGAGARVMVANGQSAGAVLVSEGLAFPKSEGKRGWCTQQG
ncbi:MULTISPECIES: hypothetical protein [unclassified Rhizobium]|uniref:hypothetical protein n=1 Tax=unclassified Rhizobium TaxID=2613769 RepID=UPI0007133404|nr:MULTISPECIES: hypothetical protein [unclassified Rhizobium]KQS93922.1 hypothetical protein ASG50_07405 [Rhizobium sp. Leaf386]KQT06561.1 hypothetical protein ASG42_02970 [Rhizobium sp. Leaf391]KQU04990.1 hypothetical protein ASG68_25830 [Rhizobium sp. Leaf453]